MIDDANAAAALVTLGVGSLGLQAASSVAITGGSITGLSTLGFADDNAARAAAASMSASYVITDFTPVTRNSVNGASDATETTLKTYTLPGNAIGANGFVEVYSFWDGSGATGKNYRVRWGGTGGSTVSLAADVTTTTSSRQEAVIGNAGATNSQYISNPTSGNGGWSLGAPASPGTVNTTANVDIPFMAGWSGAASGESITLRGFIIVIHYRP